MQNKVKTLCLFVLAITLVFSFIGCSKDNSGSLSVTAPNTAAFQPTGTIQGHMYDSVTNQPIVGARIDIAVGSAVTSDTGEFVIYNVPANTDALNGSVSGSYLATIDLKNVSSPVLMTSATTTIRYANYAYYDSIEVNFTSLDDTEGGNAGGGSGSNHDTPVTGLVAHVDFHAGKLAANIVGVAYRADNLQNVGPGYTVKLLSDASHANSNSSTGNLDNVIATTTTGTNGDFTFSNVESLMTFEIRAQSSDGLYVSDTYTIKAPADLQTKTMNIQSSESPVGSAFTCEAVSIIPADEVHPIVTAVSPESGVDVDLSSSTTGNVVFTFSEAINPDAYATTLTNNGVFNAGSGLYQDVVAQFDGVKADDVAFSLSWSTDAKALTVTIPNLAPSSKYHVSLAGAVGNLQDIYGNTLATSSYITTTFTTNGAATAAAPTGLVILSTATIDWDTTSVDLDWLPAAGDKQYAVYRTMIQWPGTTSQTVGATVLVGTNDSVSEKTDATVTDTFLEGDNIPLAYDYMVKGVNSDGVESAATATVRAADVVNPQLETGALIFPDQIIDHAGTDTGAVITLYFNEPMNESAAETLTNYTIDAVTGFTAPTIAATALNYSGGLATPHVAMTFTSIELAVTAGPNGLCQTTKLAGSDDVQAIAAGSGTVCVSSGANAIMNTVPAGDDTYVPSTCAIGVDNCVITSGDNGVCNTTLAGDDVNITAAGAPSNICVGPGTNGTLDTSVLFGDDAISGSYVIPSTDGICSTPVVGDDTQATAVGNAAARCVTMGADGILQTSAAANDRVTSAIFRILAEPAVTDVAGNAMDTTADSIENGNEIR